MRTVISFSYRYSILKGIVLTMLFWPVIVAATGITAICSFVFINRYLSFKRHKNTVPFTLAILLLNMWILLSITYLLPLDVFYAAKTSSFEEPDGTNASQTLHDMNSVSTNSKTFNLLSVRDLKTDKMPDVSILWYIIYWLEFAICWFVLPVLISYLDLKYFFPTQGDVSHRRSVFNRVKKAIFTNVKFYALCAVGLLAGIVYLELGAKRGLADLKPLIISLSHLYSLSYTLVLLAMGLILLPKSILLDDDNENKLFVELSKSNDESNDAKLALTEYASKILSTAEVRNGDVTLSQALNECKLEVQSLVNEHQIQLPAVNRGDQSPPSLKKLNQRFNAFKTEYYNYLYYQTKSDRIIHNLAQSQVEPISWMQKIGKWALGLMCLTLSALVMLLELTPSRFAHGNLFGGGRWFNFLLEISILVYNTLASLYAMSCFKFANLHLIPNGQSSPQNALYYSLYSSRLLLPLCFNFITLISHTGGIQESSFERVLYQDLKLIPLVDILNRYLPVVFIIAVPLGYFFNLKNKVLIKVLGREYCYELFGILADPTNLESDLAQASHPVSPAANRSRLDEDYEYSLQDGRFLFERATNNHRMLENNTPSEPLAYL
ncbi:LAME_0H15456g1_1 [Lachancea meyersii CBS 8951]|uniref:LAME_0H15456g1_1 n=1 Tax=Lachancea meyersii CBS 8951 TaxID=1266667 RepID=A0A1G4KHW4_9SACH|nr:LAME_0H15456g1_1 [Lachancea meyersii CBS 8951]